VDPRSGVARGVQAAAGHRGEAAVLEATEAALDPEVRAQAVQVVVPVPGDPAVDRAEQVLAVEGQEEVVPEGVDRVEEDLAVAGQVGRDPVEEDQVVAQAVVVRVEVGRVGKQCTNV